MPLLENLNGGNKMIKEMLKLKKIAKTNTILFDYIDEKGNVKLGKVVVPEGKDLGEEFANLKAKYFPKKKKAWFNENDFDKGKSKACARFSYIRKHDNKFFENATEACKVYEGWKENVFRNSTSIYGKYQGVEFIKVNSKTGEIVPPSYVPTGRKRRFKNYLLENLETGERMFHKELMARDYPEVKDPYYIVKMVKDKKPFKGTMYKILTCVSSKKEI